MSGNLTMYQVTVEVVKGKRYGYCPVQRKSRIEKGVVIKDTILKMFHIEKRTPKQALNACKKHGNPIHVQKVDAYAMHKNFEELPILNGVYVEGNPYNSALAMDEMIWEKRNKRRANLYKDKLGVANI